MSDWLILTVIDNNEPVALTVGLNLEGDTWRAVTLGVDQSQDRYVLLKVDGGG
jgi:hypothetical protein